MSGVIAWLRANLVALFIGLLAGRFLLTRFI